MSYRTEDTNILDLVNVDLDTFQIFIEKVNLIVDHMRHTVVTVSNTSAYDGNNTGNGFVFGIFGANTMAVTNNLRGGNVSTTGTLTITSRTDVTNSVFISNNLTVEGHSNVFTLFVRGQANVANTLNVTGNTTLQQELTVTGNTNLNNFLVIKSDLVVDVVSANLSSNITSPQLLYTFPKATYNSAKITLQTKAGTNSQFMEAVLTHSGSDPYIAIYGIVASPPGSNNGLLSASSNATHIRVEYKQTNPNTAVKTVMNMVR